MRLQYLALWIAFLASCAAPPAEERSRAFPAFEPPAEELDPWSSVDSLEARGEAPRYDYPENLYDVPVGPYGVFEGRWLVAFETVWFRRASDGQFFETGGVDAPLMELVDGVPTPYDWHHCLDVRLVGAVSELPSPFLSDYPWLVVREVISWKLVSDREDAADTCFEDARG